MDAKMNHSDLTALFAKKAQISGAKAETFTKAFFDIIIEGLEKDGLVKINGLGTFKVTDVASRESVDVNTGEKIEIKGHKKLAFLPAEILKEKVNKPFAMFEPVEIDESYVDEEEQEPTDSATEGDATVAVKEEIVEEIADTEEVAEITAEPVEEVTEPKVVAEPETVEVQQEEIIEEKTEKKAPEIPLESAAPVQETVKSKSRTSVYVTMCATVIVIALLAISVPSLLVVVTGNKKSVVIEQPKVPTMPAVVESKAVADTVEVVEEPAIVEAPVAEEPYVFKMVEELAAKSVGSINIGDTLLYTAKGTIETHIVAENETLTRIALKYYGDKRLWPYIVQYNKLANPNGLCKGMELEIPQLEPVKQ